MACCAAAATEGMAGAGEDIAAREGIPAVGDITALSRRFSSSSVNARACQRYADSVARAAVTAAVAAAAVATSANCFDSCAAARSRSCCSCAAFRSRHGRGRMTVTIGGVAEGEGSEAATATEVGEYRRASRVAVGTAHKGGAGSVSKRTGTRRCASRRKPLTPNVVSGLAVFSSSSLLLSSQGMSLLADTRAIQLRSASDRFVAAAERVARIASAFTLAEGARIIVGLSRSGSYMRRTEVAEADESVELLWLLTGGIARCHG